MPKPLRSETVTEPQNLQFKDFGVLNTGGQSKGSLFTSLSINVVLLVIAVILGAAAKRVVDQRKAEELTFVTPLPKPPELPKPKLITPKIPPPPVVKPPEPKVTLPEVKLPEPKPVVQPPQPKPLPVVVPAPPKAVVAAAAPRPVAVHLGQSASVPNHDPHPSAVALGQANNPIAPSNRPATSAVNLGQSGLPGMPGSNNGRGPAAERVSLGSGQPNGSVGGSGSRAVVGVSMGVPGGTGRGPGNGIGSRPQAVQLGRNEAPPPPSALRPEHAPIRSGPQVISKPRPVYTAEATALHLEGTVSVKIRVAPSGSVSVLGVTSGLGHGLDQSAIRAVEGTVFKPALDASGNPTEWEGVVRITFQLAG